MSVAPSADEHTSRTDAPAPRNTTPAPRADATPGPRTGGKLFRATAPFAVEDPITTWRLFLTSILAFLVMATLTAIVPTWPVKALGSVVLGLILVRLFIFVHDEAHGAIFRATKKPGDKKATRTLGARIGKLMCDGIGIYLLTPPSVWKETHDYHHRNNAKMVGASIGSYPTLSTKMWRFLKPADKRAYRIARHPLTMLLGYFTVFAIGMCISPFRRDPKAHWMGPVALVLHIGALVGLTVALGWQFTIFVYLLPMMIAMAAGSYLFYAQHNFPDVDLKDRKEWDYTHAALRSSSMFDMSPWMHWFTGNIGYHHVHHLNHRIPFYRLPEAMAAIPELQDPGRTSWAIGDIAACLRLKLWDPDQKRMVPFPR